ncbi:AAA family ATPase [Ornithinibacillus sp. FSL M8-0202]|uniref:ATP-binding protein n=1 Tax=Ornithinibacillus sp. FSL M8-0202 TaxID=2921616 RepID=UPI0030D1E15C
MKLLQATIYGFGKWVDYHIDFSKDSFLTIYGENESGKTTLQRFILFMLFGMPPKQRKFYQPKTSSKMGGSLTVFDPEVGIYTIERLADTRNGVAICHTADGEEHDENWLRDKLHGIDEKTYQAIFSFSAADLSRLQDVKQENISEVLLGIGLTGSSKIHSIEKRLDQRISDYFKPYGKNPVINQQLVKLEQLHVQLHELENEESTYREKKNAIIELETDIEHITQQMKEYKQARYQLDKLMQVLPQVEAYKQYQLRLNELPEEIPFPEEGIERLESLKDKWYPLKSERNVLERNREKLIRERKEIQDKNNDFPYEEAVAVCSKFADYQKVKENLSTIQEQIKTLDAEINTGITELNVGLNKDDLAGLSLPFHLEKQWADLKQTYESLKQQLEVNKDSIQLQQAKQNRLEQELQDIELSLLKPEERKELEEVMEAYKESKLLHALQKEHIEKQKNWSKTRQQTNKRIGLFLSLSVFIGTFFGILAFVLKDYVYVSITAVSLLFGVTQWIYGKKSIHHMEAMLRQTIHPQSDNIVITEDERAKAAKILEINRENLRDIELLEDKLRDSDITLNQLREQKILLEQRELELEKEIANQRHIFTFLSHVEVVYWQELFHSLRGLLKDVKQVNELQIQEHEHNQELERYQETVNRFFERHHIENTPRTLLAKLEFLELGIEQFRHREKQLHQTKQSLREVEKQLNEIVMKCDTLEQEMNSLFMVANVKDEEAYYLKARELKEQKELVNHCEQIKAQYSSFFTKERWEEIVACPPKLSNIELEVTEILQEIQQLEEEREKKRNQLAQLKLDIKRLEASETYSEMIHKFEQEKEKLRKLAREWAIHKVAKELLTETKGNFRDKYLSKVMEKTTHFFQLLTNQVYINVYPPVADKPFVVERVDHIRFQVQELSQGTINQLYVALRLAISLVMSESLRMPFIMDDAFVHFDVVRYDRMISILNEISKQHQILLFTCKEDIPSRMDNKNLIRLTNTVPLVEN